MIKQLIEDELSKAFGTSVVLEVSRGVFGDYSLTPGLMRQISEKTGKSFQEVLALVRSTILDHQASSVDEASGYINISLSSETLKQELALIDKNIDEYLSEDANKDKTIVFDYSSPNIAKPFSVGHLRSTIIGQANYNIHKALGYKTIGINHIGDWGTQFGKLIVAIKKWGDEAKIKENPIEELNALYVKFHSEAENDESLNNEAREWFKRLESGDEEARAIWQKCVDLSFVEFSRIYKLLGVKIDETTGESFYEDKLQAVIDELKQKNLLIESEGAQVVELDGMIPALIQKQDGATLYMTRDLAALKYRLETFKPEKIIYHVGNDQSFHFQQLIAVATKLGWLERSGNPERPALSGVEGSRGSTEIVFAGHGMIRLPEGKMSTRAGRTVLLQDLIDEATKRARSIIDEKESLVADKDQLARDIAISAIKYADLSQNRKGDVVFSFDKIISLKGNCAPYLQYSLARIMSLNDKANDKFGDIKIEEFLDDQALGLTRHIIKIKEVIKTASGTSSPNILADYIFELNNEFNSYYEKVRIISDDKTETARNLYIIKIVQTVLSKVFDILGIVKLEKI